MTFLKEIWKNIVTETAPYSGKDEAEAIAYMLIEKILSCGKPEVLANKEVTLSAEEKEFIAQSVKRLQQEEPVQYILGAASFFGRDFKVDPSVLIPRPETEELVAYALSHCQGATSILDIGTGSGCIAITLALEIPDAKVTAIDVSRDALRLAKENSSFHKANVTFKNMDILTGIPDSTFDVIISNPPYVTESDKEMMKNNVLNYEPALALFVKNDDPLLFYKRIIALRPYILSKNGKIFCEINENLGTSVEKLFASETTRIEIIKDIHGKDRILFAQF